MTVATPNDVVVTLGRPICSPLERQQIQWWLDGVEMFIVRRFGPVADLDQAAVKYVEVEAVAAKIKRAGREEESVTVKVDDGSVTRRYSSSVTAGDITDDWWDLLDPNDSSSGAWTINGWPRSRRALDAECQ